MNRPPGRDGRLPDTDRRHAIPLNPGDIEPIPQASRKACAYASADPMTDVRLIFAGTPLSEPGRGGYPTRTTSGEWMIRTLLDLPYAMLASLEAEAGSEDIGELIRAALVAAGHGSETDIAGIRADRHATDSEQAGRLGMLAQIRQIMRLP